MLEKNSQTSVAADYPWIVSGALEMAVSNDNHSASPVVTREKRVASVACEKRCSNWSGLGSTIEVPTSYLLDVEHPQILAGLYYELAERLESLSSKLDGWKGPDSVKAISASRYHAQNFLWKLALENVDRRPAIGLDYEGTFSFSWFEERLKADLTVYDDGSYSFFATDGDTVASVDDASVQDPLHSRLLSVLLS
tara:strand:+ start:1045 stop:1629 length:585 start_codon:yes stop_codon:yes gene_type:complete